MAKAQQKPVQQQPVENWRANVPLFRAAATAVSILLTACWFTWQGSQWVAEFKSTFARLETRLVAIEQATTDKVNVREMEHRFALLCARAPMQHRVWVCAQQAKVGN